MLLPAPDRLAHYHRTKKGLYMLATILKGEQAVRTTLSIIETYAEVRAMKRELLALHAEPDAQKRNSIEVKRV